MGEVSYAKERRLLRPNCSDAKIKSYLDRCVEACRTLLTEVSGESIRRVIIERPPRYLPDREDLSTNPECVMV